MWLIVLVLASLVFTSARRLTTASARSKGLHEVQQDVPRASDSVSRHLALSALKQSRLGTALGNQIQRAASGDSRIRSNESGGVPVALEVLGASLQALGSPTAAFTIPGPGLAGKTFYGNSPALTAQHLKRVRVHPAVPSDSHLYAGGGTELSELISQIVEVPQAPVHGTSPWLPSQWLEDLFDIGNVTFEGNVDLQRVVDTLLADIPTMLQQDAHWDLFAEDFKVIDQTGAQLEGLESTKTLFHLLHRLCEHFDAKNDNKVRFIDGRGLFGPVDPFLVAKYKVQLSSAARKFFRSGHGNMSFGIEVDAVFHLNDQNQVDYMRIDKCLVNGHELKLWPEVKLSDDPAVNLEKIKEWALDVKLQELFRGIADLDGVERAELFEEARRVKPWKEASRISQSAAGVRSSFYVIDFGSGYTRANLVQLGTDGSATSKKVESFRGLALQKALTNPSMMEQLVEEIAEALPSGNILAGATAGVRSALHKGTVKHEQVHAFEEAFARKLGSRARFNVLTVEEEAQAEWTSIEYALRSMEQMGAHGVPKVDAVHGMLSSGGVSCQFACRSGKGGPEFLSFDNLIGDGFGQYDEHKWPVAAEFAKILPGLEARVRENVVATQMHGLKGTYVLTELWNSLSFKGKGIGPEFLPYQSVPVSDVLVEIEDSLQKELSSNGPLSHQQAKVVLVATIARTVFQELFDPSAQLSFMDGDDMNWSVGWACMENDRHLPD